MVQVMQKLLKLLLLELTIGSQMEWSSVEVNKWQKKKNKKKKNTESFPFLKEGYSWQPYIP